MLRLTERDLNNIRERLGKATEGNWNYLLSEGEPKKYIIGTFNGEVHVIGEVNNKRDAEFIIKAHEDIKKLIKEVEVLKEMNEGLVSFLESKGYSSTKYD